MTEDVLAKIAAAKAATSSEEASATTGDEGEKSPSSLLVSDTPATKIISPVVADTTVELSEVLEYDEIQDLTNRTNAIRVECGNFSDIPINSQYWTLMNRLRGLLRDKNA